MRRLLSAIYVWAMHLVAPAFGLDEWETWGDGDQFWRYDVARGEWETCGRAPDGCPNIGEWLSQQ